jgi:hypothetical protein
MSQARRRLYLRRALLALAVLVGVFITGVLVMASTWPTLNRVEAGKSLAYPELRPHTYQLGYDRVYDEALAAAREQPRWLLLSEDRQEGVLTAESVMDLTGWKHQIQIQIKRRGDFVSRVYMVSQGQDSPGDLGQNARNIRSYYEALDKRLGAARVDKDAAASP